MKSQRPALIFLLLTCFFFSGLTSLIYEVLWLRMITRVIGGAPFAVSIILAIFMGGLGLGSFLAGRTIDRVENPFSLIRLYAVLEIAIGFYALIIPLLITAFEPLFSILYNFLFPYAPVYHVLTFAGCAVILGLPVLCMGATLPVLCKFYVTGLEHLGGRAGLLYGLNTIGGAAGAFVCGFFLLKMLGIYPTMWIAVGLNFFIGVACLSAAAGSGHAPPVLSAGQKRQKSGQEQQQYALSSHQKRQWQGALVIFGISGFCAMASEVLWTRLLGLIIGPTTYSFTIVLVTFILGLALGNIIFGRLADRSRNPFALLAATQVAAAFLVLGVSQLMGNSQLFFAKLLFTYKDSFALQNMVKGLCLFALMIPPTLCFGAAFPLVGKIYTRTVSAVGRSIGSAYAVNTLGAVTGSFFAGFILIPLAGKETGLALTAGLQLAAALVVFTAAAQNPAMAKRRAAAAFVALAAGISFCTAYPSWDRKLLSLGKYHRFEEIEIKSAIENTGWLRALTSGAQILAEKDRGELLYYGDGIGGFITVLKYRGALGGFEHSLATSGKIDASSRGDMNTQTLLAHVPMLLHKNPEKVMVLGLASGITAGEVLYSPVQDLDVIEINERAVEAARFFKDWNNNVLENEKTDLIIQDGLAHLRFTREKYDVIISEPSNPWMEGMAALFTKDFFSLAKDRLNKDGIFVQWFHCYQMDWPTLALVGRTFESVFPQSMLVNAQPSGSGRDFLMVGFRGETGAGLENVPGNIQYAQKSENIDLRRPGILSRMIVSQDLKRLFGKGPVNTEANPILEFAAPRNMYRPETAGIQIMKKIRQKRHIDPEIRRIAERMKTDTDARIDYAAFSLSVFSPFAEMVDLSRATSPQKEKYRDLITSYCKNNPVDYSIFRNRSIAEKCRQVQIRTIEKQIKDLPDKALSHSYLAGLYLDSGDREKAVAHYNRSLFFNPEDAGIHNNIGFLLHQEGRTEQAIKHYKKALGLKPDFARARGNLAGAYTALGNNNAALRHFEKLAENHPDMTEARLNAAMIYYRRQNPEKAVSHLRRALQTDPEAVGALNMLAWILATTGDKTIKNPEHAVSYAQKACSLKQQDAALLFTLSVAHAEARQFTRALDSAKSALARARNAGQHKIARVIENHIRKLTDTGSG
ncbi:MAG: fused MFS/spermidine synthase [Spirochaetaceae bacterium]|nr:fused MFS/spermidine synthase [Spirochaetaceae bacterium]